MIKYSSYTNHLRFSLHCHHNKILPKDLQLKSRIKTERSKIILQHAGKLLLQERLLSFRKLTRIETDLLAKCLNFSLSSKTMPNKDIIATIEDVVKSLEKEEMKITTPRILPRFRNVPIEDDKIISFDVTSLYTNIPIIDTLILVHDA